ncbi:MAG TPA: ABC transporter substrate-binding protein [Casimicrobiaceae bacterium]|nr:ABC transporter substrate-binding protein [Casimicrobiaceae bacterium]
MKTWSTKRGLSSLAAAAMLTLMAGAPAAAADTPPGFPKDKVTIEIWWHEYGPFTTYMKELIEAYKTVRPNVTVNPVITSSGDINQKLTVALATGTGPDIMDQDASFYELYYAKGVLEPLNLDVFGAKSYDEIVARYTPGGIAAGTFGGKVYALPYQGNSMSLFINNKAFAAAGLDPVKDAPKTWEDMKALGPKLKIVQGTRTVQKAFDFPYHSPRWEVQMFQPLVEQFGGKLLSDDGKTVYLNSPEAVKALTLWRDVTKATGDPKTTLNTPSNPNQDFIDGRTAMWVTGPWATSQIRQSAIKDGFTVVSYPQVNPAKPHTIVYGWMWGVNKAKPAAQKVVAWDFIRFVLSKPDEWLSKVAFVQPVKGVNETAVAKSFPFFDVHMRDVATASWYIRSEYTNEIGQAIGRAIERTVYDGVDPKASLDQAQAEIDKILKY